VSAIESRRGTIFQADIGSPSELLLGMADSKTNGNGPERHLTREELEGALGQARKSETMLREFVDGIPTPAWSAQPDGAVEFVNQRWQDYTGLSSEEARGWGWRVAIHLEDYPKLLSHWRALLASCVPGEIEARLRRHDGEYRWFLFQVEPLLDPGGKVIRWHGTNTDIESRKRAEEKLQQDESDLRRVTDAIPHTIVIQDATGNPLYANRAVRDYTGLSCEDVPSSDFRARIFHPEDLERLRDKRSAALRRGLPFEIEQRARRQDGQYRWFLIRYNPFRNEQGELLRWYATGTDIDNRKRSEDRTRNENAALREEIERCSMFEEIVGSSKALRQVLAQVAKVAPTDSTVLISGETGTGKELVARAIHKRSDRASRAFIRVNCAAFAPSLIASELFGHEKGSFTGALQRRLGRFESADRGTIFLDEVGELPPETQSALLRVLQEREFERVGGNETISVDVRVLAATNTDLSVAVEQGSFRRDLFYRLNVFPIEVPTLRERADDIPLLVEYLVDRYGQRLGKEIKQIGKKAMDQFLAYEWPGNIRELQNVIERAVVLCEGETLTVDETWFKKAGFRMNGTRLPLAANLAEREKEMVEAALRDAEGVVGGHAGAAARLGLPRQTLESKIRKLGINRYRFKSL